MSPIKAPIKARDASIVSVLTLSAGRYTLKVNVTDPEGGGSYSFSVDKPDCPTGAVIELNPENEIPNPCLVGTVRDYICVVLPEAPPGATYQWYYDLNCNLGDEPGGQCPQASGHNLKNQALEGATSAHLKDESLFGTAPAGVWSHAGKHVLRCEVTIDGEVYSASYDQEVQPAMAVTDVFTISPDFKRGAWTYDPFWDDIDPGVTLGIGGGAGKVADLQTALSDIDNATVEYTLNKSADSLTAEIYRSVPGPGADVLIKELDVKTKRGRHQVDWGIGNDKERRGTYYARLEAKGAIEDTDVEKSQASTTLARTGLVFISGALLTSDSVGDVNRETLQRFVNVTGIVSAIRDVDIAAIGTEALGGLEVLLQLQDVVDAVEEVFPLSEYPNRPEIPENIDALPPQEMVQEIGNILQAVIVEAGTGDWVELSKRWLGEYAESVPTSFFEAAVSIPWGLMQQRWEGVFTGSITEVNSWSVVHKYWPENHEGGYLQGSWETTDRRKSGQDFSNNARGGTWGDGVLDLFNEQGFPGHFYPAREVYFWRDACQADLKNLQEGSLFKVFEMLSGTRYLWAGETYLQN